MSRVGCLKWCVFAESKDFTSKSAQHWKPKNNELNDLLTTKKVKKVKIKKKITQEIEVHYLKADCEVRYWEDSTLNGKDDVNGEMPCVEGKLWLPIINLETGQIINWDKGNEASIHYKICDMGNYYLLNENKQVVASVEDDYVISMMSPREDGYGDYIMMDVDKDGLIDKWRADLSEFENQDED